MVWTFSFPCHTLPYIITVDICVLVFAVNRTWFMHALYNKAINVCMCNSFSGFFARFTQTAVQHDMLALKNLTICFSRYTVHDLDKVNKMSCMINMLYCRSCNDAIFYKYWQISQNFLPPKAYTRQQCLVLVFLYITTLQDMEGTDSKVDNMMKLMDP